MKVIFERPPNYDAVVAAFPAAGGAATVLFCYGDVIFNPTRVRIPREIMAHEEVHAARQMATGPEAWWARYLTEAPFRFDEELAAHVVEWSAFRVGVPLPGRTARRRALAFIAGRLAGPLYGHVVDVAQAARLLVEQGGRP